MSCKRAVGLVKVTILLSSAVISLSGCEDKNAGSNIVEQSAMEETQDVYNMSGAKTGDIAVGEKGDIPDSRLEGLELDLSGVPSHSHEHIPDGGSTAVQSSLDWSNGAMDSDGLSTARELAVQLYQSKMNKDGDRYVVEMDPLWNGDLSKFDVPVFYYVSENGVLYVQMKVNVYDLSEKTTEARFVSLGLRYDEEGDVMLVDEEG